MTSITAPDIPTSTVDESAARRKRTGRKYTSRACEECRRRRAKCDGVRPSCARCLDRGVRCQYSTAEDGRQPAPKSYVVMLRNRIELLEKVLQNNGIDADASIAQLLAEDDPNNRTATPHGDAGSNMEDFCLTFDGALTLDESLNFDQDGEVRYFGPTSGRLLFQSSSNESPSDDVKQTDASCISGCVFPRESSTLSSQYYTKQLDLDESQVFGPRSHSSEHSWISEELQAYLIDLYFEWDQPWLQVVNEQLFRDSLASGGRYCSPLLLNCILALGSRYCDRLEVRTDPNDSNTAGKAFILEAERLIQNDLRWPKITTIQSLAIMSVVYIAMGHDAAGWLHQGMANRLAIDMGLNMDPAVLPGTVALPEIEIELRRQIYWALYCHDKLAASYTGRVCTLLDCQGAVNKPYIQCASNTVLLSANGQPRAASQKDVVQLHKSMIDLCQILEKILLSLWSPKPLSTSHQRFAFFDSCILELKTWLYDLPSELKLVRPSGPSRFPHVYTLCMVYHTVVILLCGPFIKGFEPYGDKASSPTNECPAGEETPQACIQKRIQKAFETCNASVRAMCFISQKYRKVFGSFKLSPVTATHCTLSFALIIIERCCAMVPKPKPGDEASPTVSPHHAVMLCLQVLRELSTSWNTAKRIGRNLERVYLQRYGGDSLPLLPQSCGHSGENACVCPTPSADISAMPKLPSPPGEVFDRFLDPKDTALEWPPMLNVPYIIPRQYNGLSYPPISNAIHDDPNAPAAAQIFANSEELFANNLGFAFSPDCLPSDYNMFSTLNQMYLEETW
ncbi:hypothetical protein N7468_006069 [Penicillium chermesinum]|uniref:Zn(2)-C6 fungal-type domain-containing protein n=1 Tax=Penicillium chermesinum TaxID=63820 RepID=A0A9W9P340_9EURO|nr:uncharacterized protein N7468_006069 [Penicillium chermesinum]KAJ5233113.1 hypothetical protein N7468_006069 [Penicillium chermesinum]